MNDTALDVCGLTKSFEEFTLDHISFQIPRGYIMGMVGKNGAGKTTTIKLILELLQKEQGSIQILGKDASEYQLKQEIAVVFDDIFVVEDWRVSDVEAAISPFYEHWDATIFHNYLHRFSLSEQKRVKALSKGMKMKLMLAIALSHQARLLILDEPTSGLDPVARDELLDILLEYMEDEQNSILFSTHITSDLDKIADYVTIMQEGTIFYTGSKDELLETYCCVKGDTAHLDEVRPYLIGIQEGSMGFHALIDVAYMGKLTKDMITEQASIDDILIHLSAERGVG